MKRVRNLFSIKESLKNKPKLCHLNRIFVGFYLHQQLRSISYKCSLYIIKKKKLYYFIDKNKRHVLVKIEQKQHEKHTEQQKYTITIMFCLAWKKQPHLVAEAGTNISLACPGVSMSSYVYLIEWVCEGCHCQDCPPYSHSG